MHINKKIKAAKKNAPRGFAPAAVALRKYSKNIFCKRSAIKNCFSDNFLKSALTFSHGRHPQIAIAPEQVIREYR